MDDLLLLGSLTAMLAISALFLLLRNRDIKEPEPEEDAESGHAQRNRVRDDTITCQICLGDVGEGSEYSVCRCGKTFHTVCVRRTGFCPYCERPYEEGTFRKEWALGEPKEEEDECCPLCGRAVSGTRCECGALFPDEEGLQHCPSCNYVLGKDDERCPRCGEQFEMVRPVTCPVCGSVVHEGQKVCRCGLVMDDLCPECGWKLGEREKTCPICGLDFELVRRSDRDEVY